MKIDLLEIIMFLCFLFIIWTIFFGAIIMDMFQSNAMFIGAIFIGLMLLEIKFVLKIIDVLGVKEK